MTQKERRQHNDSEVYFNNQFEARPVLVEPGGVSCLDYADEMLVATVGSGILMTIFDQELKAGAMAYIMLPKAVLDCFPFLDKADQKLVSKAFEPIENCFGEMKKRGAGKNRIIIRLFGAMAKQDDPEDNGIKTCVFVQEYLYRKGLQVINADIGGPFLRRVHFFPTTGRAVRLMLKRENDFEVMRVLESGFDKEITSGA